MDLSKLPYDVIFIIMSYLVETDAVVTDDLIHKINNVIRNMDANKNYMFMFKGIWDCGLIKPLKNYMFYLQKLGVVPSGFFIELAKKRRKIATTVEKCSGYYARDGEFYWDDVIIHKKKVKPDSPYVCLVMSNDRTSPIHVKDILQGRVRGSRMVTIVCRNPKTGAVKILVEGHKYVKENKKKYVCEDEYETLVLPLNEKQVKELKSSTNH